VNIKEAITRLYERLPVEERQSFSVIRGYGGDKGGAVHRFIQCGGGRPIEDSIDEATQTVIDFNNNKLNTNFCIGLADAVPEPGKGLSVEMVTGLFGFFSDVDIQHEAHGNGKRYPPTVEDALWCLEGLKPTWTINSGHGIQAVYLFEEPYFFENTADKNKITKLSFRLGQSIRNRARRKGWELDATHEFTRGFRLPGTLNYKGGGGG